MKKTLLAAALLLTAGAAGAATQTSAFTYQGNLTANGQPASGNFDLTFRLFDAATGGNQVGTSIAMPGFPVVNGRFVTDVDYPGAFNGQQRWIEVAVNGQVLLPRQAVNATPVTQFALSGSVGPSGATGPAGPTGPAGSTGPAGATGAPGSGGGSLALPYAGTTSADGVAFSVTQTNESTAIYARSGANGSGVAGSFLDAGVRGDSEDNYGVLGTSANASAVHGESIDGAGIEGHSGSYYGVVGGSDGDYPGVNGYSASGYGVAGRGQALAGVYGDSTGSEGVRGHTSAGNAAGLVGVAEQGTSSGVVGIAQAGQGVVGISASATGTSGASTSGTGVYASSGSGQGLFAHSDSNYAIATDGPARQSFNQGGWVKAMIYAYTPHNQTVPTITRCWNSQLPPASASVPPCGFSLVAEPGGSPILWVNLNFDVRARFFSVSGSNFTGAISVESPYSSTNCLSQASGGYDTTACVEVAAKWPSFYLLVY